MLIYCWLVFVVVVSAMIGFVDRDPTLVSNVVQLLQREQIRFLEEVSNPRTLHRYTT